MRMLLLYRPIKTSRIVPLFDLQKASARLQAGIVAPKVISPAISHSRRRHPSSCATSRTTRMGRVRWVNGLLTVLPFVLVMIAGPQIVSAVFLATSVNWARNSLASIGGASLSITAIVTATYFIVRGATDSGGAPVKGDKGIALDVIILVLLLFLAVKVYRERNDAEPPKWMGRLEQASPSFSFKLGFCSSACSRPTSSRR